MSTGSFFHIIKRRDLKQNVTSVGGEKIKRYSMFNFFSLYRRARNVIPNRFAAAVLFQRVSSRAC